MQLLDRRYLRSLGRPRDLLSLRGRADLCLRL
ncbi:hypothetical protein BOS5A_230448 [Bosea sp. EC-HK365B]|nr:hypothetical protein BOSE21B_90525 [Bosea sp. 21B]CAD5297112.1 hypothetical protein BOSE7B_60141 [Bosea sp. 7B]VVT61171.1 hypothetical protein BOS5A_230448 [Bosea sp. EC-HK365B]VXB25792.1 hypothetical protein BOSE127_110140 [Bosea sp. 127]